MKADIISRMNQFISEGINGCTKWSGQTDKNGYPRIKLRGRTRRASRALLEHITGQELPRHLVVMHTCDNPECLNVTHLTTGTQGENWEDRRAKGRT